MNTDEGVDVDQDSSKNSDQSSGDGSDSGVAEVTKPFTPGMETKTS